MSNARPASSENNKMSPEVKWKLLFSTLLNIPVSDLDLEIEVNKENLLLKSKTKTISEKIINTLNSPENIRANLSYTLIEKVNNSQQATPVAQAASYPPAIELAHGKGNEVYKQLFGERAIRLMGAIDWSDTELARPDCYILTAEQDPDYPNNNEETYKNILSGATFEDLRLALSSDPDRYKPVPNRRNNNGVLAKHIDKIFYKSNDSTATLFDYGLLIHCISAPAMKVLMTNEDFQININIQNLINYLSIIFPEKFVLSVTGNPNEPQQATPITFSVKRSLALKNIVSLILDRSGSMASYREQYINHVKDFVNKLAVQTDYQDAIVRITCFSDTSSFAEYNISQLASILGHLENINIYGGTELNTAMNNELSQLLKRNDESENVTVVLFTDGHATDQENAYELSVTADRIKQKQGNRPRVFALGLGSIDETKLRHLATITDGAYINLQSIEDFKNIIDHLEEMGRVKEFITFIQENTTFVTPSYVDDINVAAETLQIPGDFKVGDINYQVTQGGLTLTKDQEKTKLPKDNLTAPKDNGIFKTPAVTITIPPNSQLQRRQTL
jgi:hypothetical protein